MHYYIHWYESLVKIGSMSYEKMLIRKRDDDDNPGRWHRRMTTCQSTEKQRHPWLQVPGLRQAHKVCGGFINIHLYVSTQHPPNMGQWCDKTTLTPNFKKQLYKIKLLKAVNRTQTITNKTRDNHDLPTLKKCLFFQVAVSDS